MVEKISLSNGLILEIWDYSRKLAGDRWLVGFLAQVGVEPEASHFSSPYYYEKFKEETDGKVYYRYRKERTFVPEDRVGELFKGMKESFLTAVKPYLSKPDFKERLIAHEVKLFEQKVDWEDSIRKKDEEAERLEKLWQHKKYF